MGGRLGGYGAYGSFVIDDKIRRCRRLAIPAELASTAVARPQD
jgi:hypothetical protein